MARFESIADSVGNTPLVRLNHLTKGMDAEVYVKVEYFNPLSSVKDRIGKAMIDDAEKRGVLGPNTVIVEPTSGNTGIALAFVAAARGYKLILTMPESASLERRKLMLHLGAELELTPATAGMHGAVERARQIAAQHEDSLILQQFENPANPRAHEETTGPEIWNDLDGKLDVFMAGVGTGGTISGTSRYLKRMNPDIETIALEPASSAVISGRPPGPHPIQGIGAGFIPGNFDRSVVDRVMMVRGDKAYTTARALADKEGILGGISSGANVHAALELAKKPEYAGKRIVTVVCSCGERYLSTPLFK